MNALPDLRHLVFLSDDLDSTVSQAQRELGLVSGVRNTEDLAQQGYHHEVLTIGRTFLEFTAPVSVDSEPAKLLADRGAAGLAVIVQVSDIEITKKRALDLGIRPEGE